MIEKCLISYIEGGNAAVSDDALKYWLILVASGGASLGPVCVLSMILLKLIVVWSAWTWNSVNIKLIIDLSNRKGLELTAGSTGVGSSGACSSTLGLTSGRFVSWIAGTDTVGLINDDSTGGNTGGCTFSVSACVSLINLVGAPFFRGILCKYPNPISQPMQVGRKISHFNCLILKCTYPTFQHQVCHCHSISSSG